MIDRRFFIGGSLALGGCTTLPRTSNADDWRPALGAEAAVLLAGDSLAGLRLPLDRLAEKNLRRALTVELREGSITVFIRRSRSSPTSI